MREVQSLKLLSHEHIVKVMGKRHTTPDPRPQPLTLTPTPTLTLTLTLTLPLLLTLALAITSTPTLTPTPNQVARGAGYHPLFKLTETACLALSNVVFHCAENQVGP